MRKHKKDGISISQGYYIAEKRVFLGHGLRLKGGQQQLGGFRDSRQLGA